MNAEQEYRDSLLLAAKLYGAARAASNRSSSEEEDTRTDQVLDEATARLHRYAYEYWAEVTP